MKAWLVDILTESGTTPIYVIPAIFVLWLVLSTALMWWVTVHG